MRKAVLIFLFLFCGLTCFSQEQINLTIYFRFDKYDLDSVYRNKIDSIILNRSFKEVSIKAHCDSFGSNGYNDALSLKRANEVKRYLVSKSVNENSITVQAFGKRLPLNQNENPKARALNRRAEILFVVADSVISIKTDTLPKIIEAKNDSVPARDTSILSFESMEVGKTFVLKNINFVGGRHVLLPQSNKTLKLLLNTLKENPNLKIEIQGHICCAKSGDGQDFETGTWNLSWNRAKAVYDYLVRRGISPSRLSYRGFGASHKLVREFTEEDRTTNRRVEIKVLEK